MKFSRLGLLALLLLQTAAASAAEPLVRSNGYVVHYAALVSTGFTPEIAQQYGITRAANHGVLIINVQREATAGGKSVAVAASASGSAASLMGDRQVLQLRPAGQSGSGDLLADFATINGEYLRFDVDVLPQGG
ncbi:MAG: DUF4426 domain-containing protein, partial [Stenotrophobium sp.]